MDFAIINDIVSKTLFRINSDLGTVNAIDASAEPSAFFDVPGNKVSVQTGFRIGSYYYVSVNHPLQVQGLSEAIYDDAMELINKHLATIHPAPNGHPHEIYFPTVTREVFNIDCKYHKTGLFSIVTYTNKVTGESITKHYTYATKDRCWVISSSENLKTFREMRGEIAESISKIDYQFFIPDDKGTDAAPRVEGNGIVFIPSPKHCFSLILDVRINNISDGELSVEIEKVALVNGNNQFVRHKFTYRIWLSKAGKVMINKKKYEEDWWGLKVYNLADFEQHPLNEHYHGLLSDGYPVYKTDNVWVTKGGKVYVMINGRWMGLDPELSNHYEKMMPPNIYAEYLIYRNFSKSI